jgi:hypothetical protein
MMINLTAVSGPVKRAAVTKAGIRRIVVGIKIFRVSSRRECAVNDAKAEEGGENDFFYGVHNGWGCVLVKRYLQVPKNQGGSI